MHKNRLEAFSDGVLAIIITIMVLELKAPSSPEWGALREVLPTFSSYVLSFCYIGIYWNNHHHLLHAGTRVNGLVLWANLNLLFWLSLFPFCTAWVGRNHLAPAPIATYGAVLLAAALSYYVLQMAILAQEGSRSRLATALGADWKGKLSPLIYLAAIPIAFVYPQVSLGLYVIVALIWIVPDSRIERTLAA